MDYPHWFCKITYCNISLPVCVVLISQAQAVCAVDRYIKKLGIDYDSITSFTEYQSLDRLLHTEGLAKEDVTILTDDDRGKCIAFRPCDSKSGRCDIIYYDCDCFI